MTHQAHGSSIVRARLTGEIEFHTAFDIKSLPSTSWLGWVEKTFKDERWGPQQGKVLNTHCPHFKHYHPASTWSQWAADVTVASALSLITVPLQNQQLHHVPYLIPPSSCYSLHACCVSLQDTSSTTTLISRVPSPSAMSQCCFTCCWARRSTCCFAGQPRLTGWPEDGSFLESRERSPLTWVRCLK